MIQKQKLIQRLKILWLITTSQLLWLHEVYDLELFILVFKGLKKIFYELMTIIFIITFQRQYVTSQLYPMALVVHSGLDTKPQPYQM